MKPFLCMLLLSLLPLTSIRAKEPNAIYLKNSTKEIMRLWVKGKYQGWLKPGETRYSVPDGFITDDSARPTDSGERTPVKESHGGWKNEGLKEGDVSIETETARGVGSGSNTVTADENGEIRFVAWDWLEKKTGPSNGSGVRERARNPQGQQV